MNNTLSTPTANDARSLAQSLRSKGLPSLSLQAERLGKHISMLENQVRAATAKIEEHESTIRGYEITLNDATARIKELEETLKDAEFMANVWNNMRKYGFDFVSKERRGDPDGVDFVANRILGKVQS